MRRARAARRPFARFLPVVQTLEDRSAPTDLGLTAALLAVPALFPTRHRNISIAPPP